MKIKLFYLILIIVPFLANAEVPDEIFGTFVIDNGPDLSLMRPYFVSIEKVDADTAFISEVGYSSREPNRSRFFFGDIEDGNITFQNRVGTNYHFSWDPIEEHVDMLGDGTFEFPGLSFRRITPADIEYLNPHHLR